MKKCLQFKGNSVNLLKQTSSVIGKILAVCLGNLVQRARKTKGLRMSVWQLP